MTPREKTRRTDRMLIGSYIAVFVAAFAAAVLSNNVVVDAVAAVVIGLQILLPTVGAVIGAGEMT